MKIVGVRWGDGTVSSIDAVVESFVLVIDAFGFPRNSDFPRTLLTSFELASNGEVSSLLISG